MGLYKNKITAEMMTKPTPAPPADIMYLFESYVENSPCHHSDYS
jgi:hypothetical protein